MTQTVFSEKWVDIPCYEGYYQVSSFGRVRTLDRYLPATNGGKQLRKGCVIQPSTMPNGYLMVSLHKGGKSVSKYVHRLVASAFVPNPLDLKEVNHKDEDKTNNRLDNLEWCTHRYNINYGTAAKRISIAHLKGGYGKVPIIQLKDGVEVAKYDSAADAERATGICASSIRKVCLQRPKFHTAGGYGWRNDDTQMFKADSDSLF